MTVSDNLMTIHVASRVAVCLAVMLSLGWTEDEQVRRLRIRSTTVDAGFSSSYPQDIGIETHPSVVFAEQFEEGSLSAVVANWTDSIQNTMSIDTDVPSGSANGSHSLKVPRLPGDKGGQLFKGLAAYRTTLYVRFYIKYSVLGTSTPHHSGVWIGGEKVPTPPGPFFPDTHSGTKPCSFSACAGLEQVSWFWTAAEQGPPAFGNEYFDSYSAFQNMRADGGGAYFGNLLTNNAALQIAANTWTCVEHLVKVNTVASPGNGNMDGEWAAWLNGVPVSHVGPGFPTGTWTNGKFTQGAGSAFEGIAWRDDSDFGGINWLHLQNYYEITDMDVSNVVWFDHVVAATSRIGCMI